MRDDFESAVADRFMVLDDVDVPDIWGRVHDKLLDPTIDESFEAAAMIDLESAGPTEQVGGRGRWMLAAAAVLIVVASAVVVVERGADKPAAVTTNTPPDTTTATVDAPFATAIESSGLLIEPSAEEIALASDTNIYQAESASTQVSGADQFVSLRKCRTDSRCNTGWAYVTGSIDGGEVHHGLLGEADEPAVFVLDDRFFVVMEISHDAQPAPTTWLIDSLSGGHAELTWRDQPTTMSSREQALVVSDGPESVARLARMVALEEGDPPCCSELFLPRVVDARDGTIRPLLLPSTASVDIPVAQHGRDRIWIGTTPGGNDLGLAYSDDGGATWTDVALPAQLLELGDTRVAEMEGIRNFVGPLSVAADGDRIAVTDTWESDTRDVFISGDSGLNWSTVTLERSSPINGAHVYVLADQRLLLVRSIEGEARYLLVSTGSDWTTLEENLEATQATMRTSIEVNRDGIVTMYHPVGVFSDGMAGGTADTPPFRHHSSADLTTWRASPVLDDRSD